MYFGDDFYSVPVLLEFNQVGGEYQFMVLLSLDILNSKYLILQIANNN